MADYRKPPVESSSRREGATLPSDTGAFSIETTTMRLKSLKLRRSETPLPEVAPEPPSNTDSVESPRDGRPSGKVRHDERGMAVWDWAVATGEFATLSTTRALKKLEIADLEIADHDKSELSLEASGRDKAGGADPYNQRGAGKRQGEAAQRAGVTGSTDRARGLDQSPDTKDSPDK